MATQPTKGCRLNIRRHSEESESRRPVDGVEKIDCRSVPGASAEECPRFPADVITGHKRLRRVARQKCSCQVVRTVATVAKRHPKGCIDEDHR